MKATVTVEAEAGVMGSPVQIAVALLMDERWIAAICRSSHVDPGASMDAVVVAADQRSETFG